MSASHSSRSGNGVKSQSPPKKHGQSVGRIDRDIKPRPDDFDLSDERLAELLNQVDDKCQADEEYQERRAAAGARIRQKWAEQDALREAKLEAERKAKWDAEAPQRAKEREEFLEDVRIREEEYAREKAEMEAWKASSAYQQQVEWCGRCRNSGSTSTARCRRPSTTPSSPTHR